MTVSIGIIEVKDDGNGIDIERVRTKGLAVEKLGLNSKSITSLSVITSACSGVMVPFSIPFVLTLSISMRYHRPLDD